MTVKTTFREDIQCKFVEYSEGNCICTVVKPFDTPSSVDIRHIEFPIAAPSVTYYKGIVQWDFSKVMILEHDDIPRMLENTKELLSFCEKVRELPEVKELDAM